MEYLGKQGVTQLKANTAIFSLYTEFLTAISSTKEKQNKNKTCTKKTQPTLDSIYYLLALPNRKSKA